MNKNNRNVPLIWARDNQIGDIARQALAAILLLSMSAPVLAFEFINPGETQEFTVGDDCSGTPFSDTALKGTGSGCDTATGHVEVFANLNVGAIRTESVAFSTMFMDFVVPSTSAGSTSVLDASVSAKVDWNGILYGNGVLGAGASIKIEMLLVDEDTGAITGRTTVLDKQQENTGLKGIDVGGSVISGSSDVSFSGKVTTGHNHSIRLKATCKAESGLIGAVIGCAFEKAVLTGNVNRFVNWDSLFVTIEQDIQARFDNIDAKLLQIEQKIDTIDTKVDNVDAKIDALNGRHDELEMKLDEAIRLLLTPQGSRESYLGSFPLKPDTAAVQGGSGTAPVAQQTSPGRSKSSRSIRRRLFGGS